MSYVRSGIVALVALVWATPAGSETALGLFGSGYHGEWTKSEHIASPTKYTGPGGGVAIETALGGPASLAFRPNVIFKGQRAEIEQVRIEGHYKTLYGELPVMLKLAVGSGSVKPYVLGGAAVGYMGLARVKEGRTVTSADGTTIVQSAEASSLEEFKRFEVSISAGAGLGIRNMFLEVLYLRGMTDIRKSSASVRNTGFRGNLGFYLN